MNKPKLINFVAKVWKDAIFLAIEELLI